MQIKDIITGLETIQLALDRLIGALNTMAEDPTHTRAQDSPPFSFYNDKQSNRLSTYEDLQLNSEKAIDVLFTPKEMNKMPKEFRKLFRTNKINAHVRKRANGTYEIRCQLNNNKITASAKTVEEAKEKFIARLCIIKDNTKTTSSKKILFGEYFLKWLDLTKKPFVKEKTFSEYKRLYNTYIKIAFECKSVSEITQFDLQKFFNVYERTEKFTTARRIHQLLKAVFEYAYIDEIISRSPMAKIKCPTGEKEQSTALTRSEELNLVNLFKTKRTVSLQAFIFILYTGIRRSELASAKVDNDFVTVTCAKTRKGRKDKIRKIPISPMLKTHLPSIDVEKIKALKMTNISKTFKEFMPAHHLHELRHTFITRCQEVGIRREIVSLWAGHVADTSITSTVYTHLEQNEQIQLDEIKKFNYKLKS